MASEIFSPTSDRKGNLVGGVSSAENGDQLVLRVDPTTKRLLVSATIASYTGVTDGEAVDAADVGTLSLGTDGTNYQILSVDTTGRLNVIIYGSDDGGTTKRIIKTDSGGAIQVDLEVTSVTVTSGNITADTELTTGDLDTGAGTDTRAVVGLVGSASGGGALIPGSATDGLLVNLGTNNDVVEASAAAILTSVQLIDNAISGAGFNITQLGGAAVPIGGGLEATALRVTVATDSTGVLSIDDNNGIITVDGTVAFSNTTIAVTNIGTFAVQATLTAETTKVIGTVNVAASQTIAVTNAGTFVIQENGAALTALQLVDDIIVAQGTALGTTKVGLVGGSVTTAAPTFTTGQINQLSLTTSGALRVDLGATSANGTPLVVDLGANNDVTVTSGSITADTELPAAATVAADTVTPTVPGVAGYIFIKTPGANTWDRLYSVVNAANTTGTGIAAAGIMAQFDDTSPQAVTENQFGNLRMSAAGILYVGGNVAHDGADTGNPIKIGAKAVDLGITPTAVAAADRTDLLATRAGQLFTLGGHPNTISQNLQITDADGAQTDAAIITVAAGTAIVVTQISVNADNANTVNVSCRIGFGTVNTPAADAAGVIFFHPGIPAGGGQGIGVGSGIIGIGASNEDLRISCADPVSGSISVQVTYFTIAIG